MKSAAQFRLIGLILAMTAYLPYDTHTAQETVPLFWCHAILVSAPLRDQIWERIFLLLVLIA